MTLLPERFPAVVTGGLPTAQSTLGATDREHGDAERQIAGLDTQLQGVGWMDYPQLDECNIPIWDEIWVTLW